MGIRRVLPALLFAVAGCSSGGAATGQDAGVTIYVETSDSPDVSAQTEIVTGQGRHVYVDALFSQPFAQKPTKDDILLITHSHPDHEDGMFTESFPGKKIVYQAGSIDLPDVKIKSIPAAHNDGDPMAATGSTDYIFVIDAGGVRIAHFGDLGQAKLTADQMSALGTVDVAFSQLENPYSGMDAGSRMGFDQMNQVKPKIFVPTHLWSDKAVARAAAKEWPAVASMNASIHLTAGQLPSKTTVLFMGLNARQFAKDLALPPATW